MLPTQENPPGWSDGRASDQPASIPPRRERAKRLRRMPQKDCQVVLIEPPRTPRAPRECGRTITTKARRPRRKKNTKDVEPRINADIIIGVYLRSSAVSIFLCIPLLASLAVVYLNLQFSRAARTRRANFAIYAVSYFGSPKLDKWGPENAQPRIKLCWRAVFATAVGICGSSLRMKGVDARVTAGVAVISCRFAIYRC
jgi:hypothetical protein